MKKIENIRCLTQPMRTAVQRIKTLALFVSHTNSLCRLLTSPHPTFLLNIYKKETSLSTHKITPFNLFHRKHYMERSNGFSI
jgi:hypothetical protein